MNSNFKAIGSTRLKIKPQPTAPEADALATEPSEVLLNTKYIPTLIMANRTVVWNVFTTGGRCTKSNGVNF